MNLKNIMLREIGHIQKYGSERQFFMAFLYFSMIAFVEDSLFKHVCYSKSLEVFIQVRGQICFLTCIKKIFSLLWGKFCVALLAANLKKLEVS